MSCKPQAAITRFADRASMRQMTVQPGYGLTESGVRKSAPRICIHGIFSLQFEVVNEASADVAELADALDLGSSAREGVEVRVLSSALQSWLKQLFAGQWIALNCA
jgi:hypothetical protein